MIFNQDDPIHYVYIVKDGIFSSQIRLSLNNQKTQGLDPSQMLKESDESSGKLASMGKTKSTKQGARKFKLHEIATLGNGSVIGCEDVLALKSDTHVTKLTCLSMKAELYRVEKNFFFSKLSS